MFMTHSHHEIITAFKSRIIASEIPVDGEILRMKSFKIVFKLWEAVVVNEKRPFPNQYLSMDIYVSEQNNYSYIGIIVLPQF